MFHARLREQAGFRCLQGAAELYPDHHVLTGYLADGTDIQPGVVRRALEDQLTVTDGQVLAVSPVATFPDYQFAVQLRGLLRLLVHLQSAAKHGVQAKALEVHLVTQVDDDINPQRQATLLFSLLMHQDLILTDGNRALGKLRGLDFRLRDGQFAAQLQLIQVALEGQARIEQHAGIGSVRHPQPLAIQ